MVATLDILAEGIPATKDGLWMVAGALCAMAFLAWLLMQIMLGWKKLKGRHAEPVTRMEFDEVRGRMSKIEGVHDRDMKEIGGTLAKIREALAKIADDAYRGRKSIYQRLEGISGEVGEMGRGLGERIATMEGMLAADHEGTRAAMRKTSRVKAQRKTGG